VMHMVSQAEGLEMVKALAYDLAKAAYKL
jgi:hypothetical protein